MNRLFLLVLLTLTGCGASGDASEEEDVDEGALGACAECSSASDLLAKSVVVEVATGGTEAERKEFSDTLAKLSKLMEAGIKNLPPVNDAALGPSLAKGSIRFLTTMDGGAARGEADGVRVLLYGALAHGLYGLGARTAREGAPACRIAPQPSLKGGSVDGALCEWVLPAARAKVEAVRRGKLTDAEVARLVNLAYEPRR